MVYIGDVVSLGRLPAVVIDDAEELVLALLEGVLGLAGQGEHLPPDLQVHSKVHPLHHLHQYLHHTVHTGKP